MKQCVLTGGGSKFGEFLTREFLDAGYYVHLITSNGSSYKNTTRINVIDVDWHKLSVSSIRSCVPDVPHIDVVFFNHNSSALNVEKFLPTQLQSLKDWQQSYFVACQFPYYLVNALSKKISSESKIGWMLSELIKNPAESQVGFADYMGNKFTNACVMKNFAMNRRSCFFGLHPDGGLTLDSLNKAKNMVKIIDTYNHNLLNGNILDSQGNKLDFFV